MGVVVDVYISPLNKGQRLVYISVRSSGKWLSGKVKAIGMPAPTLFLSALRTRHKAVLRLLLT
jgi:hypothetical protein